MHGLSVRSSVARNGCKNAHRPVRRLRAVSAGEQARCAGRAGRPARRAGVGGRGSRGGARGQQAEAGAGHPAAGPELARPPRRIHGQQVVPREPKVSVDAHDAADGGGRRRVEEPHAHSEVAPGAGRRRWVSQVDVADVLSSHQEAALLGQPAHRAIACAEGGRSRDWRALALLLSRVAGAHQQRRQRCRQVRPHEQVQPHQQRRHARRVQRRHERGRGGQVGPRRGTAAAGGKRSEVPGHDGGVEAGYGGGGHGRGAGGRRAWRWRKRQTWRRRCRRW